MTRSASDSRLLSSSTESSLEPEEFSSTGRATMTPFASDSRFLSSSTEPSLEPEEFSSTGRATMTPSASDSRLLSSSTDLLAGLWKSAPIVFGILFAALWKTGFSDSSFAGDSAIRFNGTSCSSSNLSWDVSAEATAAAWLALMPYSSRSIPVVS